MKNKFAALALAATLVLQAGAAFADEGPLTSGGTAAWTVISFPLRVVTGVAGGALGGLGGGLKGIVRTEEKFAANTYGKADENPLLVPVGLVGSVVAIPVGFLAGLPQGAVDGGQAGWGIWDNL